MNNKGQTLVLFVALIPFIFILFVFVFDLANIESEKTKLDSIAKSSLNNMLVKDYEQSKIENAVNKNDKTIEITSIDNDSICLKKTVEPVFGYIIGYKTFDIKLCLDGKVVNGKLIVEEKGN